MSDELVGQVPVLENKNNVNEDGFILVIMDVLVDNERKPIVGNLIGIRHEECMKIDLKVSLQIAYDTFNYIQMGGKIVCQSLQLHLGSQEVELSGTFNVVSPGIMDIDHVNKVCTLSVDFVKM